jgi:hypothetical protein
MHLGVVERGEARAGRQRLGLGELDLPYPPSVSALPHQLSKECDVLLQL